MIIDFPLAHLRMIFKTITHMSNYEKLRDLVSECNRLEENFFDRLIQEDVPLELKMIWNEWSAARTKHRTFQGQMLGFNILDTETHNEDE
ncbi:hypothetical protein CY0110_32355 [Crocosphaera chwakensis CCY0110]|uniref:Uncharacterized protein n=2 Tax=Crocosphaera TaxID=263510 RepID=A3IS59_9CHRO|nr:hypothetical protein CY0110_32355 [Crocosphaera chwakensis CCY0110]